MELLQLLVLVFLAAAVWLWLDSLKVREIGVKAAQRACADEGLQFLDDTVAIRSLRLVRDDDGRLRLRRIYGFEYSDTGDNRRPGTVTLLGQRVELLHVRPQLYVVPKAPEPHETLH
ncbi:MAG TPA: DUF3301 domain-containing protein [Azonexus sp.]|mgnify:FL=1|jgi:hypothetical protein|uniref:DUF3301 domain-containing protein n=1 Tax=Candidatus Dechloromonas phosphorivorans TaxID=2899244 RepID=A0A9D7LVY2_9RHOO|nr:DUF3301 domain-containing protein [Candidatus Dechloromonas phosphorivorans]HRH13040.1 DUF3301 domain-containing protein [Azonexus sp.]